MPRDTITDQPTTAQEHRNGLPYGYRATTSITGGTEGVIMCTIRLFEHAWLLEERTVARPAGTSLEALARDAHDALADMLRQHTTRQA